MNYYEKDLYQVPRLQLSELEMLEKFLKDKIFRIIDDDHGEDSSINLGAFIFLGFEKETYHSNFSMYKVEIYEMAYKNKFQMSFSYHALSHLINYKKFIEGSLLYELL